MGPGKARIDEFSHVEVSGIRGWSDYWAPGGPTATPSPGPAPPRPSQDPGGRGAGVACGRRGGGVGGQPGRRHAGRPCPRRLRGWSDRSGSPSNAVAGAHSWWCVAAWRRTRPRRPAAADGRSGRRGWPWAVLRCTGPGHAEPGLSAGRGCGRGPCCMATREASGRRPVVRGVGHAGPGRSAPAQRPVRGVLPGGQRLRRRGSRPVAPGAAGMARPARRCRGPVRAAGSGRGEPRQPRPARSAVRDDATRGLALADSRVQEFGVTTLPLGGPSMMLLVAARAPVSNAASASAYLTRCQGLETYLDQYAERLRSATGSGLLPVAPLVHDVIEQLRDYLAHPARDPLVGHRPAQGWDGAAAWREEL